MADRFRFTTADYGLLSCLGLVILIVLIACVLVLWICEALHESSFAGKLLEDIVERCVFVQ